MTNLPSALELTGQRFGMLTAIKNIGTKGGIHIVWLCICDCGNTKEVRAQSLKLGKTKSCGCYRRSMRLKKFTGCKFGRLTAIEPIKMSNRGDIWRCVCDCGKEAEVRITKLTSGETRSCGCLKIECSKKSAVIMHEGLLRADGTNISMISSTNLNKNNTTGVKGVYLNKRGEYFAQITLKRKTYHLGVYKTLEEAAEARKKAEEKYYHTAIKNFYEEHPELKK